jgi:hypothetical protein
MADILSRQDRHSSKKTTCLEKAEQRAVIKLCADIKKTYRPIKSLISRKKHCSVGCSSVFKWHRRFLDRRGSLKDDFEGRSCFRDNRAVKMTFMT